MQARAAGAITFIAALSAYLLLDWATFTPVFMLSGIAPWNPPIGLALAVVLRQGPTFFPLLFIAPLVDDLLVRVLPFPIYIAAVEAALTGAVYSVVVWMQRRSRWLIDRELRSMRDLSRLLGMLGAAAFLVSLAHNLLLHWSGLLLETSYVAAVVRYWIGELIGILVVLPFVLIIWRNGSLPAITPESIIQVCAIFAAITVVFGLAGQTRLHFSYVLFLPIMWMAVRSGLGGAATGLMVMHVGIMVALHLTGDQPSHVPAFQALMMVLSLSGLIIGVLIDERDSKEQHLRRQQEAIARASRIGTLGEVTTLLAHELNQPLTAARNFARIVLSALEDAPPDATAARAAGRNALQQIDRGAQIIRQLRDFIRVGGVEIGSHDLGALIEESLALMQPEMERIGAAPEVRLAEGLPRVAVDPLQIEQVLVNLLRNSIEAIAVAGRPPRIEIAASRADGPFVALSVADNGCGFPAGFDLRKGLAIESSKTDGLGVGLSLCVSIIERHGGRLEVDPALRDGARVTLTLPIAGSKTDG